jgi:hypothetical protein
MARATKAIDKPLAALNSFRGCLDPEGRNRGRADMLLEARAGGEREDVTASALVGSEVCVSMT